VDPAEELDLLRSIVRKIVRGDPHGQAYFDVELGIIDAHVNDFTPDEESYLRAVQTEVGG